MDRISLVFRASITVALAVSTLVLTVSASLSPDRTGLVIDDETGTPLQVTVKAWPDSLESSLEGECWRFGSSALDATQSKADGTFLIKVDLERNPTYLISYCASGYNPRADVQSATSETAVVPTPARLWRKSSTATDARIEKEILAALNNLTYTRSISPEKFDNAVQRLGGGRGSGLPAVVKAWRPQPNRTTGGSQIGVDGETDPIYTIAYVDSNYDPSANMRLRSIRGAVLPSTVRIVHAGLQLTDVKIEREILSALNDLAYFRSINAERFDSAVQRLGGGRAAGLSAVIKAWRPR